MSLESFVGFDSGEPMSSASLEQLRQRMKAASAQIAAIRKEEKKRKKKEDELIKILLKFIKKSDKKDLVLLISRALEQNLPANFILAIILLNNKEIREQLGKILQLPEGSVPDDRALVFFNQKDESLPLKVKIELDMWIKEIIAQADETPQKLIKTAYKYEKIELPEEEEDDSVFGNDTQYKEIKKIQPILIQLTAFVINDFLEEKGITEDFEKLQEFAHFIIKGIVNKAEESLDNRKLLD